MRHTSPLKLIDSGILSFPDISKELLLSDWENVRNSLDELLPRPFSEVSPGTMSFRSAFITTGNRRIGCNIAIKCRTKHLWIPMIVDSGAPEIYLSSETIRKFGIENPGPFHNIEIGKWNGEAILSVGKSADNSSIDSVNILGMRFLGSGLNHVLENHFDSITGSTSKKLPGNTILFLKELFPISNKKTQFIQEIVLNSFETFSVEELRRINFDDCRDVLMLSRNNLLDSARHVNDEEMWYMIYNINVQSIIVKIRNSLI